MVHLLIFGIVIVGIIRPACIDVLRFLVDQVAHCKPAVAHFGSGRMLLLIEGRGSRWSDWDGWLAARGF